MRILRRVVGDPNFGEAKFNDLQVRELLGCPSLDCLLLRRRLLYFARLVQFAPGPLQAVLQYRHQGQALDWVVQICDDLQHVWRRAPSCSRFPDPILYSDAWQDFIVSEPMSWRDMVHNIAYSTSVCDAQSKHERTQDSHCMPFVCNLCPSRPAFLTSKALKMHQRTKHTLRCPARLYVDESAICPICKTDFKQRLRCIAHLSDSRRTKCWDQLMQLAPPPLPAQRVEELDLADREARKTAKRKGHTHPLAVGSAATRAGKCIGFARM